MFTSWVPSLTPGIVIMFSPPVTGTVIVLLSTVTVTFPSPPSGIVTLTCTSSPTGTFSTSAAMFGATLLLEALKSFSVEFPRYFSSPR